MRSESSREEREGGRGTEGRGVACVWVEWEDGWEEGWEEEEAQAPDPSALELEESNPIELLVGIVGEELEDLPPPPLQTGLRT